MPSNRPPDDEILGTLRDLARGLGMHLGDGPLTTVVSSLPWPERLRLKEAATERLMEEGFDTNWVPNAIGRILEATVDALGIED